MPGVSKASLSGSMLCRGLLFLYVLVDEPGDRSATKASWRLMLALAVRISHEASIERFLRADEVIVVECKFAAFAAL